MLRNCHSAMISVYLWLSVKSLLMMAAEKTLVWFLLINHRTIKAVKGPQEVSNQTSCPKQGWFWGQSRLLLPWINWSLKLLRYRCGADSQGGLPCCLTVLMGSSLSSYLVGTLISFFLDPKKYPWKKYPRKIMLQHKPVKILWMVPIRTWYFPFTCFH